MDDDVRPVESGALAGILFMLILTVLGCGLCNLLVFLITVVAQWT